MERGRETNTLLKNRQIVICTHFHVGSLSTFTVYWKGGRGHHTRYWEQTSWTSPERWAFQHIYIYFCLVSISPTLFRRSWAKSTLNISLAHHPKTSPGPLDVTRLWSLAMRQLEWFYRAVASWLWWDVSVILQECKWPKNHQEFQVPKTEAHTVKLFWVWAFPFISLTYSLYRWVPPF